MRLSSLAALALATVPASLPAAAADLPNLKAPPVALPAPAPQWSGVYLGVNVGAGFGGSNVATTVNDLFDDKAGASVFAAPTFFGLAAAASANGRASFDSASVIGGGQIGYNFQFANHVIAGAEADIQASTSSQTREISGLAIEPNTGIAVIAGSAQTRKLNYLGTVRGRLGYLVTPTLLVFGTGGLAWGDVSLNNKLFVAGLDSLGRVGPSSLGGGYADAQVGWTAGAGVEWMFLPNWTAKAEYLRYDLGGARTAGGAAGFDPAGVILYATVLNVSTRFDGNLVRLGLNHRFSWGGPAPVVAKF